MDWPDTDSSPKQARYGTESSGFDRTTLADGRISDRLRLLADLFGTGSITVASSMPNAPSRATRALLVVLPLAEILALWVLAAIGVSRFLSVGRTTRAMQVMLVGCVVLLVLPASATLGQSRFRLPAVPALAILGAMGGTTLIERRYLLPPVKSDV